MIRRNGTIRTTILLLTCAMLLLSSCSDVPVLNRSPGSKTSSTFATSKSQGNGPPAHAPAWGYRRKHGGTTVVTQSETVVVNSTGDKDKDDDNDKTKLIVAGAAVAAGTVYAVVNERDKAKTEAKTQAELEQIRQEMNIVTVNVTNKNGSITQVQLQKQGTGYLGPKGEFYDHLPTGEELKPIYGL